MFVARPFLGEPAARDDLHQPDGGRLALEEERDRALAALKELEFDHRTGKVSDEDYRRLVGDLRRAAADALRALDRGRTHGNVEHRSRQRDAAIELPPNLPEPEPVPHEPPGPVIVPEPEPVPHQPPGPVIVPEPEPPTEAA